VLTRIRLEVTVLLALAIAITALVFALRGDGSPPTTASGQASTDAEPADPSAADVVISAFAYNPDPVRVAAGESVTWVNRDGGVPHTATADDGSWDSGVMEMRGAFTMTFDKPGVYAYICTLHPPTHGARFDAGEGVKLVAGGGGGMQGAVIVE